MIYDDIDSLQPSDIEQLVSNQVEESRTLDYKQKLPGDGTDERREFLYDVASFANADGGNIVFGVTDKRDISGKATGIPDLICGIGSDNESGTASRLESMIQDGIHPRLKVQTKFIKTEDWSVLVLRVQKSWSAPHLITFQKANKFYTRNNTGKELMTLEQIRSSFLTGQVLSEQLASWRSHRLNLIQCQKTPIRTVTRTALVVHALNGDFFTTKGVLKSWTIPRELQSNIKLPNQQSSSYPLYNADGLLLHSYFYGPSDSNTEAGVRAYAQAFRAGAIEYVDTSISFSHSQSADRKKLALSRVERSLVECFTNIVKNRDLLGLSDPLYFGAALVGVENHTLDLGFYRDVNFAQPLIESVVMVPEFQIEPTPDSNSIHIALRPVADFFAQSVGLETTPFLEKDGVWNPFMEG